MGLEHRVTAILKIELSNNINMLNYTNYLLK